MQRVKCASHQLADLPSPARIAAQPSPSLQVNYNSALDPAAAERALDQLNYTPLVGRPMRIMWSHRDPAFRKSGARWVGEADGQTAQRAARVVEQQAGLQADVMENVWPRSAQLLRRCRPAAGARSSETSLLTYLA